MRISTVSLPPHSKGETFRVSVKAPEICNFGGLLWSFIVFVCAHTEMLQLDFCDQKMRAAFFMNEKHLY